MTELQIANMALRHIGMKKLNDLNGVDPSTRAINEFFDICRDDVLGEFEWPFASVQFELDESAEDALLGYAFMYDYPTQNVATVWTVYNSATADKKHEQDFEVRYLPDEDKRVILTNLDEAFCDYSHIVTNMDVWSPKFVSALSFRLASEICPGLTGDDKKAATMLDIYNAILRESKRISSSEKSKKPNQTSSYQQAR